MGRIKIYSHQVLISEMEKIKLKYNIFWNVSYNQFTTSVLKIKNTKHKSWVWSFYIFSRLLYAPTTKKNIISVASILLQKTGGKEKKLSNLTLKIDLGFV